MKKQNLKFLKIVISSSIISTGAYFIFEGIIRFLGLEKASPIFYIIIGSLIIFFKFLGGR